MAELQATDRTGGSIEKPAQPPVFRELQGSRVVMLLDQRLQPFHRLRAEDEKELLHSRRAIEPQPTFFGHDSDLVPPDLVIVLATGV